MDPVITPPVDVGPYILAGAILLGVVYTTGIGTWVGFLITRKALSVIKKSLSV